MVLDPDPFPGVGIWASTSVFPARPSPRLGRAVLRLRRARGLAPARTITAWVLLICSIIGWPVSLFTVARDEPPFVLSLSWLALIVESGSLLTSSQVHEAQQNGDEDG